MNEGVSSKRTRFRMVVGATAIAWCALTTVAGEEPSASTRGRAAEPAAVAERFNRALADGDRATVQMLLLPNALIFESGHAETSAAEYAGHHMTYDIAFLAKIKREVVSRESGGDNSTGWVATRSRLTGEYDGKDVDLDSTETLIMTMTDEGWRIAHIHWSSTPSS